MKKNFIISMPSPNFIYHMATLLPLISTLICWSIYYSTSHLRKGRIRTISETVNYFPENRIFPIAMNIEAIMLLLIFLVRQKIIHKLADLKKEVKTKSFRISCTISVILIYLVVGGLSILSSVTLLDNRVIHLVASFFFFFGILFYFCISDYCARLVGYSIPFYSLIVPYISLVCALIYTYITLFVWRNRFIYSIGSLLEYLTSVLIFMKVFFIGKETPSHSIINGKEQNKFA